MRRVSHFSDLQNKLLGIASAISINKITFTEPATGATLTLADGATFATSGAFASTFTFTGITGVTFPTAGTLATLAGAESLSNKTLVAPSLGTPASGVVTNLTGTASININGTVGATTPTTVAATTGTFSGLINRVNAAGTDGYILNSTTGLQNTVLGFNNSGGTNVYGVPNNYSYIGNLNAYALGFVTNGTLNATLSTVGDFVAIGSLRATTTIRPGGYTVATLPAGTVGMKAYVTDALAPAFLTTLVGGGAAYSGAQYSGAAWVAD